MLVVWSLILSSPTAQGILKLEVEICRHNEFLPVVACICFDAESCPVSPVQSVNKREYADSCKTFIPRTIND